MKSSVKNPLEGEVHLNGFVIGGKESERHGRSYGGKKKKVICAVILTNKDKVKHFYTKKITGFSAESLLPMFEQHMSKETKVTAD